MSRIVPAIVPSWANAVVGIIISARHAPSRAHRDLLDCNMDPSLAIRVTDHQCARGRHRIRLPRTLVNLYCRRCSGAVRHCTRSRTNAAVSTRSPPSRGVPSVAPQMHSRSPNTGQDGLPCRGAGEGIQVVRFTRSAQSTGTCTCAGLGEIGEGTSPPRTRVRVSSWCRACLLYTSDAADERSSVDL